MKDVEKICKLALVQAEPCMFDKKASVEKTIKYIEQASEQKPDLIVFPELFIPGYPKGMNFGFSMGKRTEVGREDWKRYYDASILVGDEDFTALAEAAKRAGAYVSIGFSERDAVSGTLYNSNVIFEPDGKYKVHRKLKPTERCFVTGYSQLKNYRQNVNSYVWYLRQQGYITDGSHPCYHSFYNRLNVNEYLGFENYYFTEGFYDRYNSGPSLDDVLFPEAYDMLVKDLSTGKDVFSFHVSYQGHGPYDSEKLIWGDAMWSGDVSDYCYYVLNNYLGSVKDTIDRLVQFKTQLEELDEPVVLVVFGDHKPWLGDNNTSYEELGINLDQSTTEGFMNYYSTRYLIWANSAAKEVIGDDLVGEGPTISPCYLMNELFSLLGWDGPAYMKLTNSYRDELPVVSSNGFYLDNGEVATELSDGLSDKKDQFDCVQYYMRKHFYYSEVAS